MSLTRDEWIDMWKAVKIIEYYAHFKKHGMAPGVRTIIRPEVARIKRLIESVIGQMETDPNAL